MALTPGSKLGSYEVLSLLGAGGMGEVYRARDTRLGREVAIKILPADRMGDKNRRRRFVQEARSASALSHPNIVAIYEIESADGNDFIVMEYVPGKTLDAVIPRQGMRLGDILRIAIPIADAIARAHAAGIVHRDLKPANVVVGTDGVVKVLDFGLAKLVAEEEAESPRRETKTEDGGTGRLSRPGTVAGTVEYMSPEQATGRKVDARSDVFSFGAVLYEMVTGRAAFAGNSRAETLAAVLREQPKAPSELTVDVPRDLEKLILRCLQKDPDRRFQHMGDVKVELREIKEESESGPVASALPAGRNRLWWVAGGLAGALALSAGGWVLWRTRGAAIPVPSVVSLTSTPGRETEPTFSPDGNQVAFSWEGEKGDNWDIYLKMIGSSETRRLTTDPALDRYPSWSPDGRQIAFIRTSREDDAGTIHLVSPLGGSDRTLSDLPAFGRLSWSPDGRWLATAANLWANEPRSETRGIRLIGLQGGEVRSITSPSGLTYHTDPAFLPNGHRLAYAACRSSFLSCQIDVVELGADYVPTGTARRLTRKSFLMGGLAWARDGRSVVYSDWSNAWLWRLGIGGDQPPERIEVGNRAVWPTIAISRDRLGFERHLSDLDIYRFEAGRPPEAVAGSSREDSGGHFSPDGRRFAFESGRGGEEGNAIWLAAVDGSNPMQLTHGPGVHQGSPRWSPDGHRIAFDSQGEDGHWDIWIINADGASLRRFTNDPGDEILPSWSQDGRWIYFVSDRGGTDRDIWRAPAMGGPGERLSRGGAGVSYESTDGKTLFFLRDAGESLSQLMALPLAGGPERRVIDCVPAWGFTVGPTGVYHFGCKANPAGPPLYLLDPVTGRDRLLGRLEAAAGGMTVSPDGKTILYTKQHLGEGSDLMMIENFR
jgi:serine/threonine protein kinase